MPSTVPVPNLSLPSSSFSPERSDTKKHVIYDHLPTNKKYKHPYIRRPKPTYMEMHIHALTDMSGHGSGDIQQVGIYMAEDDDKPVHRNKFMSYKYLSSGKLEQLKCIGTQKVFKCLIIPNKLSTRVLRKY